jgi:hypothetical protein
MQVQVVWRGRREGKEGRKESEDPGAMQKRGNERWRYEDG